jgi:hypothetical protein
MQTQRFWLLDELADDELEAALQRCVGQVAQTEARIVAHLAEVDARRLHLLRGHSLWEYCLVRLGLSESEAYYRICAARLARKFPLVFELLEQRKIHLTALALIAKYLTAENHVEILSEASGKTKRRILEQLVRRFPKADVPNQLRKLAVPHNAVAAGPSGSLEPLSPDRYCLQLQVSAALKAKIELARDMMSHANPTGDLAVVVERGLDLLIAQLGQRRFGQTKRPRAAPASVQPQQGKASRASTARKRAHISHATRRQIVNVDELRCCYVGKDGHRCSQRAFLQFHHMQAWARGGPDTPDNLCLLCAAHNLLLGEQTFGKESSRDEPPLGARLGFPDSNR